MIWPGVLSVAALAPTALAQGILFSVAGPTSGHIGNMIVAIGDVDGDGADDFAVHDDTDGGSVDVHSGRTGALIQHMLPPVPGSGFGAWIAGSIAGKGDVDLDGTTDILIGATAAGAGGEVYVYSGATFALIRTHAGVGGNLYGQYVAMLGDLNGDGASEYAITAGWRFSSTGPPFAEVRSGIDGQLLKTYPASMGDNFATAYVALNDVTGDGTLDFAYSFANASPGGLIGAGEVRIISGATLDVWSTVTGTNALAFLGYRMAPLGDVDGDGKDDLAANNFKASDFTSCPSLPGQCVNGVKTLSAATGAVLGEAYGDGHTEFPIGNPVSSTSDADGDGAADVLFVDPLGAIDMAGSLSGKRLFELVEPVPGTGFLNSIAGLGDVNGDGYPEFAAGDPTVSPPGGQDTGTIWVMTTRPLVATSGTLSASAPQVIDFTLSPGVAHAGAIYFVLASATPEGGSCGGFDVGPAPVHVPFCLDPVMHASIEQVNTKLFQTTFGFLDAATGQGSAKLDATGVVIPPSVVGLVIDFFFLTHLQGYGWDKVWEAEPVEITP